MKLIALTQGQFAQVDDEDFDYLNQFNWYAHKNRDNGFYALRTIHTGLRSIRKTAHPSMHRTIMKEPEGLFVDHIDHNTLNNQKSNLRICTRQQNQRNRVSHGKSKYLGVYIRKDGFISARVGPVENYKHLGYFKTEELAARAYDERAKVLYGEFANLNFK
jgi:hypothetical protein